MACAASSSPIAGSNRSSSGKGPFASSLGSAGPANGSSWDRSASSSASATNRSRPAGVRSDVEVSATRLPFMTRIPDGPVSRLFDQFGLAETDAHGKLGPCARDDFGDVGAPAASAFDELGCEHHQRIHGLVGHGTRRVAASARTVNRESRVRPLRPARGPRSDRRAQRPQIRTSFCT